MSDDGYVSGVQHGTTAGAHAGCGCRWCMAVALGIPEHGRNVTEAERRKRREALIKRSRGL